MVLKTSRLKLRPWVKADEPNFAMLHADPLVMADQGGPLSGEQSRRKLHRYVTAYEMFGYSRLCVETLNGRFLGYCGVMPSRRVHPLGDHAEIGWRFLPDAWGNGYATEAATAALQDAFERIGLSKVFSYTAVDNQKSQAVMKRLGLSRATSLDFVVTDNKLGEWKGLVWKADAP